MSIMRKKKIVPALDEPVTTRFLVEEHRIQTRASRDGERGLPTKDEPPAIHELNEAIADRIERRHQQWQERVHRVEAALELEEQTDGTVTGLAAQIETEVLQTLADVEAEARRRIGEEGSAKSTLAAFRARKKIFRNLEGKRAKLGYFAPVAVSTLGEAVLQSFMYAEATSGGAVGAILVAAGVAGSTGATGIAGGALGTRALNETTWWGKALGLGGVVTAASGLIAINYAAAKARDLGAAGLDLESSLKVAELLAADVHLTVPGLALFVCGLANGIYCWVKGYRAFDPIIGFERQMETYQTKLDAVGHLYASVDGRLSNILDRTIGYGRDRPQARMGELIARKQVLAGLDIARRRNQRLDASDREALRGAIDAYRTTNTFVRSGVVAECLAGEIDVSRHQRSYPALDELRDKVETAIDEHEAGAVAWVSKVDELAALVADIKEQRTSILQGLAAHDPKEGAAPEAQAIRQRFRELVASWSRVDEDAAELDDGGEPWIERTVSCNGS